MKNFNKQLVISLFLLTASLASFANEGAVSGGGDCLPEHYNLPNKGINCAAVAEFESKKVENEVYQVWSCPSTESDKIYLMKFTVNTNQSSEFYGCKVFQELILQK